MIFPLYWTIKTDTSNSFQLFSNALGSKDWKNIIHVTYGSVYIAKEHKNSSYKIFVNNIRCYGTKHVETHRVTLTLMDEAWNMRWCFHVCEAENTWYREFIRNWQLINRNNKSKAAILVSVQFHTLVTGKPKLNSSFGFWQCRRYSLTCRDAFLSPFAILKVLCDSLCNTNKANIH